MKTWQGILAAVVVAAATVTPAADAPAETTTQAAMAALQGMASYSHKAPYSEAISDMYLGYDADGKPQVAVVLRSFKSYEKITAMVVLKVQDGTTVIEKAEIPDVAVIKDAAKQKIVTDATRNIAGKTVKDAQGTVSGVDAVTGATRYRARIYASFDLMVRRALDELAANPGWPRTPLQTP